MTILDEEMCCALLRTAQLGRLALTHQALPLILPVTFGVLDRDVIFSVGPGVVADAAERSQVVCFQSDWADVDLLSAWSVAVIGQLSRVTAPVEVRQAQQLRIKPWSSAALQYVRLQPALMSGRSRGAVP